MVSKKFVFLFSILISIVGIEAFADAVVYTKYDFVVPNADGVPIYYKYINKYNIISIFRYYK